MQNCPASQGEREDDNEDDKKYPVATGSMGWWCTLSLCQDGASSRAPSALATTPRTGIAGASHACVAVTCARVGSTQRRVLAHPVPCTRLGNQGPHHKQPFPLPLSRRVCTICSCLIGLKAASTSALGSLSREPTHVPKYRSTLSSLT